MKYIILISIACLLALIAFPIIEMNSAIKVAEGYKFSKIDKFINKSDLTEHNNNFELENDISYNILGISLFAIHKSHHNNIPLDNGYQVLIIDNQIYVNDNGSCANTMILAKTEDLLKSPKKAMLLYLKDCGFKLHK